MYKSTLIRRRRHLRFRWHLVAAGLVAATIVPAAGALGGPTTQGLKADGLRLQGIAQMYQQLELGPTEQGLKADGLRLQGMAKAYQQLQPAAPDVFERYAAAHPYGLGLGVTAATGDRIVDDYFRDAQSVPTSVGDRIVDDYFRDAQSVVTSGDRIVDDSFRDSPSVATPAGDRIVDDSFRDAPLAPTTVPADNGFDWGDWAIGIGSGMGLALLLGAGLVTSRQVRQRVRTA